MKANYYLRQLILLVAVCSVTGIAAQTVRQPVFTEVQKPVKGSPFAAEGTENDMHVFGFAFESAVAWGDYNNDGWLDAVIVGAGSNWILQASLYKNNGDGTFTYQKDTPMPGFRAGNATWLDYNNDGNIDLFIAGSIGEKENKYSGLWKNLGPEGNYEFVEVFIGEFEYITHEAKNRNNRYIVAADYDNDGWVDLYLHGMTEGGDRYSQLYKNINGERFEIVQDVVLNPVNAGEDFIQMNGGGAAWGDYNRDGYLDLLSNGYWNGFKNPDYNPELPKDDINWNDRDGGYITALYENNGDGTFNVIPFNKDGSEGDIFWMDYNNDGWLDYLLHGNGWYERLGGWGWPTDIYENNTDGTFTISSMAPDNGMPNNKAEAALTNGDVNNDGFEDLLFMNADPNAIFLNNNMDGSFTRQNLLMEKMIDGELGLGTYSQWGGTVSLVDYDNDGDLDAFTAAYGVDPVLQRNDLGEGIPVNEAPSVPTNLQATVADGIVSFSWDASTDDLIDSEAIRYNVFVKYGNIVMSVLPAHLETGRLKVNETLAPLSTTFYKMSGLPDNFTWGVQAIDNAKNASAFATAQFGNGSAVETPLAERINIVTEKGAIKVSASEAMTGSVEVFAVNGAKVYAAETVNTVAYLQAGVYVVKVTAQSGSLVKKVVLK